MPESIFSWSCRPQTCNFIKNETLAQAFSCEFCKFLRPPFLKNTCRRLLCSIHGALLNSLGIALRSCDFCLFVFILYSSFLNFILTYLFLAGLVYFVVTLFSVLWLMKRAITTTKDVCSSKLFSRMMCVLSHKCTFAFEDSK